MDIKLSDFILESAISEAEVIDIVIEQAMAEFEVSAKLTCAYAKQLLLCDDFVEEFADEDVVDEAYVNIEDVVDEKEEDKVKPRSKSKPTAPKKSETAHVSDDTAAKEAEFADSSAKTTVKMLEVVKAKLEKLKKNTSRTSTFVIKQLQQADDAELEELLKKIKSELGERSTSKLYAMYDPRFNLTVLERLDEMTYLFRQAVDRFADFIQGHTGHLIRKGQDTQFPRRQRVKVTNPNLVLTPHLSDKNNRQKNPKNILGFDRDYKPRDFYFPNPKNTDNLGDMDMTVATFIRGMTRMDLEREYDVNQYYDTHSVTASLFRDRLVEYIKFYESVNTKDIIRGICKNINSIIVKLNRIDIRYNYTKDYRFDKDISVFRRFFGVSMFNRSSSSKYSNIRRIIADINATSTGGKNSVFGRIDQMTDKYVAVADFYNKKRASAMADKEREDAAIEKADKNSD